MTINLENWHDLEAGTPRQITAMNQIKANSPVNERLGLENNDNRLISSENGSLVASDDRTKKPRIHPWQILVFG